VLQKSEHGAEVVRFLCSIDRPALSPFIRVKRPCVGPTLMSCLEIAKRMEGTTDDDDDDVKRT